MQKSWRHKADCMLVTARTANVNIHHTQAGTTAGTRAVSYSKKVSVCHSDLSFYASATVTLYRMRLLAVSFVSPAIRQV